MAQRSDHRFHIYGRVIERESGRGVAGLRVEAWDKDLFFNDLVGSDVTDRQGRFLIPFSARYFQELFADRQPDLFFKVFLGDELLISTEDTVLWNVQLGDTEVLIAIDVEQPDEPLPGEGDEPGTGEVEPPPPGDPLTGARYELIGRLVDEQMRAPLVNYPVHGFDLDAGEQRLDLGTDTSNHQGFFVLAYSIPRAVNEQEQRRRRILLRVFDPTRRETLEQEIQIRLGQEEIVEVHLAPPRIPEPATIGLDELQQTLQLELPEGLLPALAERNIHTLADIRTAGGIGHLDGLPIAADDPAVRELEAHAALAALSPDIQRNAALITHGYTSPRAMADATRPAFVDATHGAIGGDYRAAETQVVAQAQVGFLNNVLGGLRGNVATGLAEKRDGRLVFADGFSIMEQIAEQLFPIQCGCKDCEAAVSPLAYLADLLEYAVRHLKNNNAAITLQFLTDTFHQPFGDLPASCESLDKRVRQIRICIEVLRRYLGNRPLANGGKEAALARSERAYQLAAYQALLTKIGTSYTEIRLARTAKPEQRTALAERLGLDLGAAHPDHLDDLFLDPATGQVTEPRLEQLFGLVDTSRNPLGADLIPNLRTWRLEHLRTLWKSQDWPSDPYATGALPIIDPDIVDPDDMRRPVAKAAAADPDRAFDLWLRRRAWVDNQLDTLDAPALRKVVRGEQVPDLDAILPTMYQQIDYHGTLVNGWANTTQPADFEDLADKLGRGVDVGTITDRLKTDLTLDVDAFLRLVTVRAKDKLWENDARREKVTTPEWREVYSILVQSQKSKLLATWHAEEQAQSVRLGPEEFWLAAREPSEGDWPPVRDPQRPLIDPDNLRLEDLPEPTAGVRARAFWQARRARLDQIKDDLRATREAQGLDAVLRHAVGHPNPGNPLPHNLANLAAALNDANPAVVANARAQITGDLFMTVEAFLRLMMIKAKSDDPDPLRKPTVEEWAELYTILAHAQKGKREYPVWLQEEQNAATGVVYWSALKARLPRWRASAEARQGWRQALITHSSLPLVDPDLIGPADLKHPVAGDPAYDLWQTRLAWVTARLAALQAARAAAANEQDGFNVIARDTLGILLAELDTLTDERQKGESIEARLDQLNLPIEAFTYLMRARELLNGGNQLLASEWAEVDSILAQVQKRRAFAEWREQEQAAGLTLGPDSFLIPTADTTTFPPPPPDEPPAWRGSPDARRDWQDTLQSRIDQEEAVIQALHEAVSAAEEETLPLLRDALIVATDAPARDFGLKAKWLTDHLLIDMQAGGCQQTTRVSQAIETLQGILFAVRTRQLNDSHPNLDLDADMFDAEWDWIGSYATWRAAMFVFIYPENILLPSLRKWQTPAFRAMVSELRGNRRLTPEQACIAANTYADYYRDVCQLTLEASCQTRTRMHKGDACRDRSATDYRQLFYVFARGRATNTVYWSAFDPQDGSGYAQTFWEAVPGFTSVINLLGAAVYELSSQERFIFVFARTQEKGEQKLVCARYDLEKATWSTEPTELELPKENSQDTTAFSALVKQHGRETIPPSLAIRLPSGAIYVRQLNRDGSDWADGDWKPLIGRQRGGRFIEVCGMVENASDEFFLFARTTSGSLQYRLFGRRDDGRWRYIGSGRYRGAFAWPPTSDVFVFWGNDMASWYTPLVPDNTNMTTRNISDIQRLDTWLDNVTGVSLSQWVVADSTQYSGMTLLRFFTLRREDDPHRIIIPGWQALGDAIRDAFYRQRVLLYIDYIAGQIESNEAWREWKLADELVRQFTTNGRSLKQALTDAFNGVATAFRYRDDAEDEQAGTFASIAGLERIIPSAGAIFSGPAQQIAYQRSSGQVGVYHSTFGRNNDQLAQRTPARLAPYVTGPFDISEQFSETKLQFRRWLIKAAFDNNPAGPQSNLTYLEEAYYFVPVHLALQLQARGQYTAALDWFRSVYDYSMLPDERKIYDGLRREESLAATYQRADNWLLDPLNPHAIAATRANTYTRFTLLALVRCFLDFADAEFTRDTAESVPRARTLYMTALELLEAAELQQRLGLCEDVIGGIDIEVGDPQWVPVWQGVLADLVDIGSYQVQVATAGQVRAAMRANEPLATRLARARTIVDQARNGAAAPTIANVLTDKATYLERAHMVLLSRSDVAAATSKVGKVAERDFRYAVTLVTGKSVAELVNDDVAWLREPSAPAIVLPRARGVEAGVAARGDNGGLRSLRFNPAAPTALAQLTEVAHIAPNHAVAVARKPLAAYIPAPSFHFCIPPNPILRALRLRAELNLYKIRNCRNIAGIERELEPYAAPTDTTSGLPTIGAGGQLVLPGTVTLRPTPYRYTVLIERAKQLVGHAQQIEATFLAVLEKRDQEYYNLLKARQDHRLARAGVRLQDLRLKEAEGGVKLAELQQERAQIQVEHYSKLLEEGTSGLELASLGLLGSVAALQTASAGVSFLAAALPSSINVGFPPSVAFSPQGSASAIASGLSSIAASLSTTASILSTLASYERRAQEWEFQKSLAQQDVRIGVQQVKIAEDHVRVVGQERVIAEMQAEYAEVIVDFLANKFTNVELYDWMSDILERVYSFFLQQATAMGQLAAGQLAFERQEVPPPFIQADYWEAPIDGGTGTSSDGRAPDRRGLTGSARLLQDIYQLDQYSFDTDKRKLQLSKTISLARLSPAEFQRFRETGVMTFATPMELFDRDFPGHYLRLIKRVRTSVIALVPATQSIKATLTTTGNSRVVIGGDLFQTIVMRRNPETVALTSPRDATGLFELDAQSDMLFPFESMGVDTTWEFRMPKAANLFDYSTIADVLITIEYTALNSFDYRQQVIQSLRPTLTADRPFSFRHELADQWFDLHHPEQTAMPMIVRFTMRREDFPPNLERLKIEHVVLYFARAQGRSFEVPVTYLRFTEMGGGPVGGGATSIDGVISTRRGNAGSWMAMLGKSPIGEWELALPDTAEVRKRFADDEIEDILFVVTYRARTPEWPL